jgi:hypothetical protein
VSLNLKVTPFPLLDCGLGLSVTMPRKLSEEYVDSDDDHSFSPPAEERETRSKVSLSTSVSQEAYGHRSL